MERVAEMTITLLWQSSSRGFEVLCCLLTDSQRSCYDYIYGALDPHDTSVEHLIIMYWSIISDIEQLRYFRGSFDGHIVSSVPLASL